MQLKELYPFVYLMVLVGMVLGVGVLVFGYFGDAVRTDTSIINETPTFAAGIGNVANTGYVTNVVSVANMTYGGTFTALSGNWSENGTVWLNSSFSTTKYNVTYNYDRESQTTLIMSNSTSAISPIAVTWMPLIVTIAALAIILVLVIKSFAQKRQ